MNREDILFTRQRHDADRAGLHYDIRLVSGDKAYSWATRKEMPEPGKSIILYEQPVHSRDYALRKRIVIPKGNYGAGITELEFVRKAKLEKNEEKGHYLLSTTQGEKYLLKPVGGKYGNKAWLFKNLNEKKMDNKYLEKAASLIKQAWDGDYEDGDEYGMAANRSIGRLDVIDMLYKASRDKHVHVMVDGPGEDGKWVSGSSWKNPKELHSLLKHIRTKVPKVLDERNMQWHRDYTWSMGMKKSNPLLQQYIGPGKDQYEKGQEDSAILHHLYNKYEV